jgi:hypothetical protein
MPARVTDDAWRASRGCRTEREQQGKEPAMSFLAVDRRYEPSDAAIAAARGIVAADRDVIDDADVPPSSLFARQHEPVAPRRSVVRVELRAQPRIPSADADGIAEELMEEPERWDGMS